MSVCICNYHSLLWSTLRKFLVALTVSLRGMSGILGSASNISFVENALVIRISPSTQLAIGPAVEFTVKDNELEYDQNDDWYEMWLKFMVQRENYYKEYGEKDLVEV